MVWSHKQFLSARIRFACPVLEFFHTYKKLLEDTWRRPEFFYTFFAPLRHSYHPRGNIKSKPKLKEIESVTTALRLLWPDFRDDFHLLLTVVTGKRLTHLRNILMILDFFVPIVSLVFLRTLMCMEIVFVFLGGVNINIYAPSKTISFFLCRRRITV